MSAVIGSASRSGQSGMYGNPTGIISIDFTSQATLVTEDSTAYVFISYDSPNNANIDTPDITLLSGYSAAWPDSSGTTSIPQYAYLLYTSTPSVFQNNIVLTVNGVMGSAPPINWRAVLVVMADRPDIEPVGIVKFYEKDQFITAVPTEPKVSALTFFARSIATAAPPAANSGSTLEYDSNFVTSLVTTESPAGIAGAVDSEALEVLMWDDTGGGIIHGGPWLAIQILSQDLEYKLPSEILRPPPTNEDDFWAIPSCCECADVFLINNDDLAETWDVPGSSALIDGETLLLNYTDPDGTRWSLTNIEGWWTLPPPDLPDMKRAGYLDGSYPVDGRYDARVFTVTGVFFPGKGINVAVPRQRLLRALDAVRKGALFVAKEPVWAKQAWVYLSDQPKIDTVNSQQMTEFSFTLKAVDPVKYHAGTEGIVQTDIISPSEQYLRRGYAPFPSGTFPDSDITNLTGAPIYETPWPAALPSDARIWPASGAFTEEETLRGVRYRFPHDTTVADTPIDASTMSPPNMYRRYQDIVESAGVAVMNAGTTIVYPRFYIYGPMENPVIVNQTTSQEMRFSGVIPSGQVLIADCYWRIVIQRGAQTGPDPSPVGDLEGLNRRWMLDFSSEWIGLVPGENLLAMSASSVGEGGHITIYFRSGWLG